MSDNTDQVTPVPAESAGYLAPGGEPRESTRDRVLRRRGYRKETVELTEEDGSKTPVEIRSLTLGDRAEMFAKMVDEDNKYHGELASIYSLIYMAHDPETGERLFALDDVDNVHGLDSSYIEPAVTAVNKLQGAGKTSDEVREDEAKKS